MLDVETKLGLQCADEDAVSLKELSWTGRLTGLLLTYTMRQSYRNCGNETLEIVYSFPTSWNTAVTRFAARIGQKELVAKAMPRRTAQQKYEEHLQKGDKPLLLECSDTSLGICTANLGNIEPGETVELEISFARMLADNGGRIEIRIPTAVGDRYSRNQEQGALWPHERVRHSLTHEYKASASFRIEGPAAEGRISSANHRAAISHDSDALVVNLPDATADRDIVIVSENVPACCQSLWQKDASGRFFGAVSYPCPHLPQTDKPLDIKILVDCSGSMRGLPIANAREALFYLFEELNEKDRVLFARFGSETVIDTPRATHVTDSAKRRLFGTVLKNLQADLGGTEMLEAIRRVAGRTPKAGDILLITDGDLWDAQNVIKEAEKSGSRIFVIGLSTSPAETLLASVAAATGGAYEAVCPSDDIAAAVLRMLARMRVDSGQTFSVQGTPICLRDNTPRPAFNESVTLYFECDSMPEALPVLTTNDGRVIAVQAPPVEINDTVEGFEPDTLKKLCGLDRLRDAQDQEAQKLSETYELIGPYVSFLMAAEGSGTVLAAPRLEVVPQMINYCRMSFPSTPRACYSIDGLIEEGPTYEVTPRSTAVGSLQLYLCSTLTQLFNSGHSLQEVIEALIESAVPAELRASGLDGLDADDQAVAAAIVLWAFPKGVRGLPRFVRDAAKALAPAAAVDSIDQLLPLEWEVARHLHKAIKNNLSPLL